MKLKCGYSMGYAGTESEWEDACEKISAWTNIIT